MKGKNELNANKNEVEALNINNAELIDDDLDEISGGIERHESQNVQLRTVQMLPLKVQVSVDGTRVSLPYKKDTTN